MPEAVSDENSDVGKIAGYLRRWAIEKALPLWSSNGFDRERGGFHERLNPDGSPDLASPRRVRVQARQIYVYAHAATLGWFPDARRIMLDGVSFMVERYRAPDGKPGYVSTLAPDNSVANALRDSYDHMFVLLALSWAAKVSGDAQIRGYLDDAPRLHRYASHRRRRQLHRGYSAQPAAAAEPAHACLRGHDGDARDDRASAGNGARAKVADDDERQVLRPANGDPSASISLMPGRPYPAPTVIASSPGIKPNGPGSCASTSACAGCPPGPLAATLLRSALRWRDPKTGLLIDEADRNGPVRRTSRRTWPQTELAKAWIAEMEVGVSGAAQKAAAALKALADHYLDTPYPGGWTDQFERAGPRHDDPYARQHILSCVLRHRGSRPRPGPCRARLTSFPRDRCGTTRVNSM